MFKMWTYTTITKVSIKPKILVIGLIISVMVVGVVLTFSYFPKI